MRIFNYEIQTYKIFCIVASIKQYYKFHSRYIIPKIGKAISKDSSAYEYLPESIAAFPEGQDFIDILIDLGYKNCKMKTVAGGIATIYWAEK